MMASNSTPRFTTLPTEVLHAIACQVSRQGRVCPHGPKTDQPQQVRKRRDLLSLSMVSKGIYEVFRKHLWRSITINISEGSLGCGYFPAFPVFPPDNRSLDYTREVHFTSEFVKNLEERCPHFPPQHDEDDIDSGEDDADSGEDELDHGGVTDDPEDVNEGPAEGNIDHGGDNFDSSYDRFEVLETGTASVLEQLRNETLRSLR